MDGTLRAEPRRQGAEHCAFCREAGRELDPLLACPGCGGLLHQACRRELGRCASAGCGRGAWHSPEEPEQTQQPVPRPPSLRARLEPYRQLMRSGAATGALFLCLGAALGGGLTHPGAVWEKLTTGEDAWPVGLAFLWMTAALGGLSFGVWRTGAWLIELWSLWGQVGALARGRPARMQLRVHASGREERSRFRLDLSNADALFSAALCGALCPDWLAGLAEQEVWVYGRRSGPWLLLLDDGRLGLVHPGE